MDPIKIFLNEKRLSCSSSTIKQYESVLGGFKRHINKEMMKVVKVDVVEYLNYSKFEKKLKKSTVTTIFNTIKSFYSYLYENGLISDNPTKNIKNLKREKREPVYLTIDEVERLIASIFDKRDKLIVQILYSTGVRVSELTSIRVKDVSFNRGLIKVFGKGSKERYVIVPENILNDLKKYIEDKGFKDNDRIFSLTPRMVQYIVKFHARRAGIKKDVTPHKLRHTFATHLIHNKADIRAVQKLLGHESLNVTEIYTHYDIEDLKKVIKNAHPINKS